jgi:hypothetical protein
MEVLMRKTQPIRRTLAIVGLLALPFTARAFELKPATLGAFDRYVQLTEARMAGETGGASPFLWIDRQSDNDRGRLLQRLNRGEVAVERLETRDGRAEIKVTDGLIHHWIGTVLLPGVAIDQAVAFVQQYERYPDRFAPTIRRSRVLAHAGGHFEVAMRTSTTKMLVTVVVDADYVIDYRAVGPRRVWTKSVATHIAEVQSAGTPDEHTRPGDQASGYLWRLNTYCAFEERPEGTYEQCESISLTRDLPFGIGWMIKPFVTSIPRETLEFTLGQVRAGVIK